MSREKTVGVELTEPELRIVLSVCAKELIPQIYHGAIDLNLVSLLNKGSDALALKLQDDAKEKIPG
jgi:hypothetical protein